MRVLFLIPTLTGGGAERVMLTLLRHLDRNRFSPMLAVVDTRKAVFLDDVPADVEFVDLGCRRVRHALPAILRLIWRTRPRLVFSTLGHLNLVLAMAKPLMPTGIKLVGRETTFVSAGLKHHRYPALWWVAYRRCYRWLDSVICPSNTMRLDLVDRFGLPSRKAVVIPNPVDLEVISRLMGQQAVVASDRRASLELVAAGRLSSEKGFDLLLDALALCKVQDVRLNLLGEGALGTSLREQAVALGISDLVHFAGFQKNPYAWFAQADALVLSSRYEGFPNVVLEALACGTPVIATPAPGGLREILEPLPACQLAETISAESLADAIRCWAMRRPARIGNEAIAKYAVEAIVRRYEQVMLDISAEAG